MQKLATALRNVTEALSAPIVVTKKNMVDVAICTQPYNSKKNGKKAREKKADSRTPNYSSAIKKPANDPKKPEKTLRESGVPVTSSSRYNRRRAKVHK